MRKRLTPRRTDKGRTQKPARTKGDVGYCRPPEEHQFKPGKSGNPKGRPRGSKNESTIFQEIVAMKVPMRVGGQTRKVQFLKAMWLRVADDALKGNPKAIALFVNRYRLLEGDTPEPAGVNEDDQEILTAYAQDLAARLMAKGSLT